MNLLNLTKKYLDLQTELTTTAAAFAPLVANLRNERGLYQEDLADRLGVSRTEVAQVETGYRQPTARFIKMLIRYLESERYMNIANKPDDDGLYRWSVLESHPSDTGEETIVADGRAPSVEDAKAAAKLWLVY